MEYDRCWETSAYKIYYPTAMRPDECSLQCRLICVYSRLELEGELLLTEHKISRYTNIDTSLRKNIVHFLKVQWILYNAYQILLFSLVKAAELNLVCIPEAQ